jgi:hypothetical protein
VPVILATVNGNIHKKRPLHYIKYSCMAPGYTLERS